MEHLPIACILEFLLAMDSELSHRYLRIRNRNYEMCFCSQFIARFTFSGCKCRPAVNENVDRCLHGKIGQKRSRHLSSS